MQISPIAASNPSFARKQAKSEEKPKKEGRYFEWLSKKEANDALKMSKGREKRDGKFKFASAMAELGSILTGGAGFETALFGTAGLLQAAAKTKQTNIIDLNLVQQSTKTLKLGGALLFGAAMLAMTSKAIKNFNKQDAESTARERGFYTESEMQRTFGAQKVYDKTDEVYDRHVKK